MRATACRKAMHCRLETPVGTLWIEEADGAVSCVTSRPLSGPEGNAPVLEQAKKELTEFFAGTRKTFSVTLNPRGTDFQRAVWAALREIPYGETRSYGEIAAAIGRPKAARAVGGANNKNPILILTPCHRVIGAGGALVGFGAGLPMKEALLALEQKYK